MKDSWNIQTAGRLAVCITLVMVLLSLTGCLPKNDGVDGGLMRYAVGDVSYTAEFAVDGAESIVCACERTGGTTVLRICSPERLVGFSVTYDGNTCSVTVGGTEILLSPDVAGGLTDLFDLLARSSGGTPTKSADGSKTVVTYADGSVTIGADGVPVEAALGERVVHIGEFVMK